MHPRRRSLVWFGGAVLLLLSTPALAADASAPDCALKAIRETHTIPPYPAPSQKLAEQGTTRLMVTLDRQGVPVKVTTDRSSGFALLDLTAADWVKLHWRWQPVVNACPDTFHTLVDIVWDLRQVDPNNYTLLLVVGADNYPPDARAQGEEGIAYVSIVIGQEGGIVQTPDQQKQRISRSGCESDGNHPAPQLSCGAGR